MIPTRTDAGSRLRRLLAVLTWLARRGRASTVELSDRFGLEPDELIADLELAACCGLPPYTPDQLMEIIVDEDEVVANLGPELARPRRLTPAEGFALAASARAIAEVPGADPDGALRSALDKLEAALGERGVLRVDLHEPGHLAVIREAVEEARQLKLRYYSASSDRESERIVDPVAVTALEGRWYLDAYCHNAKDMRRFRIDRVSTAHPTGASTSYDGSDAIDADRGAPGEARGLGHTAPPAGAAFVPGPDAIVARLAVDDEVTWIVQAVPTLASSPLPDGRTEVVLSVASTVWFGHLLLRLGPHAEVLEPPDLKDAAGEMARQVLSRYRGSGPDRRRRGATTP